VPYSNRQYQEFSPTFDPNGARHVSDTPIYYCISCPETFATALASNAHHDATGHHQTWRPNQSFAERLRRVAPSPAGEPPRPMRCLDGLLQFTAPATVCHCGQRTIAPYSPPTGSDTRILCALCGIWQCLARHGGGFCHAVNGPSDTSCGACYANRPTIQPDLTVPVASPVREEPPNGAALVHIIVERAGRYSEGTWLTADQWTAVGSYLARLLAENSTLKTERNSAVAEADRLYKLIAEATVRDKPAAARPPPR
jgi:hypothetical protein